MTEQHGGVSFGVDEETRLILDSIDEFVEQEVEPRESELGETFDNPRLRNDPDGEVAPEVIDAVDEIRRASAEAGFYAMNMPEEHGGQDVSNVTWYRAKRHVAEKGRGLSEFMLAGPEGPKPLLLQAEGEQVERYLEPCIRGEKTTAFALTEPSVGSDAPGMKTTADRDGDGWVINGQKQWITNAPHCDFAQVFARTTPEDDAGRYGGITCFLVESDEFELGSRNNAVGLEGLQAEIVLDDVHVPDSRVLGTADAAFYNAMSFLSLGRLELGATAVGMTRHLLELCKEYAGEREAFGRPIGRYQSISNMVAEGRARNYAADSAGLHLAWQMDDGGGTTEESSIFKWYATDTFWNVADDAVQVHGASGLSEDNPFMEHLHLARILRIVEGTDEIQLNTVAKQNGLL
ncbi:MAG: acyl-CoA dehydrogenase [Methanobacteriota archaeon]|uniref:Acyl-CoA/acyl-ACP dehydrogenase n=1 Tax=Halorutilus salinus TaxID=2487751 RepID=A0A9Q4C0J1_9EURY|nr:acyl-CoA/acyl-ACP dehydrogenase [Halorutilus salinus]